MPFVFVYGTLKRGGENHAVLAGQRFVERARTVPAFRLYRLEGYPGMVAAPGGLSIEGELWEVDLASLEKLDELEGVALDLYVRAPIRLLPPHDTTEVETYLYRQSVVGRQDLGARFD